MSAMPRATAATLSSFGRSADTSLDMKPKTCAGSLRGAAPLARRGRRRARGRPPHTVNGRAGRAAWSPGPPAPRRSPSRCAPPAAIGRRCGQTLGGWSSSRTRRGRHRHRRATHRASWAGAVRRAGRAPGGCAAVPGHPARARQSLRGSRPPASCRCGTGDFVVAAVQQDEVEHFRERLRVDDVAVEVNRFGGHAGILTRGRVSAGQLRRTRASSRGSRTRQQRRSAELHRLPPGARASHSAHADAHRYCKLARCRSFARARCIRSSSSAAVRPAAWPPGT